MSAQQLDDECIAFANEHGPQLQTNSRLINSWAKLADAQPSMHMWVAERRRDLAERGPRGRGGLLRQTFQRAGDPWPCDDSPVARRAGRG
jgi:hypothetical protein